MKKKDKEKAIIRRFLEFMDYQVIRLRGSERPDSHAVVRKNGKETKLGIELEKYYVDAWPNKKGGSPGARIDDFWNTVQDSLRRRIPRMKKKPIASIRVSLKRGYDVKTTDARPLAGELVKFAKANTPADHMQKQTIRSFDSSKYRLLHKCLQSINITNLGFTTDMWSCTQASTANVDVNIHSLTETVKKKNKKAGRYKWRKDEKRWFLVAATGWPIVSSGGPLPEAVEWSDENLVAVCNASPFDRI